MSRYDKFKKKYHDAKGSLRSKIIAAKHSMKQATGMETRDLDPEMESLIATLKQEKEALRDVMIAARSYADKMRQLEFHSENFAKSVGRLAELRSGEFQVGLQRLEEYQTYITKQHHEIADNIDTKFASALETHIDEQMNPLKQVKDEYIKAKTYLDKTRRDVENPPSGADEQRIRAFNEAHDKAIEYHTELIDALQKDFADVDERTGEATLLAIASYVESLKSFFQTGYHCMAELEPHIRAVLPSGSSAPMSTASEASYGADVQPHAVSAPYATAAYAESAPAPPPAAAPGPPESDAYAYEPGTN